MMKTFYILILLVGCSKSYDYGERKLYEVSVTDSDLATPIWAHPVYRIVEMKCAGCHSVYRDQFVPKNTPTTMDDILDQTFFTANKVVIKSRILDTDKPMPPDFSTPLSAREKQALINYLDSI